MSLEEHLIWSAIRIIYWLQSLYFSTGMCETIKVSFLSFSVAFFKGQMSTDGRLNATTYFISFRQGELMSANYDLTSVDSIQMCLAICEFHYSAAGLGEKGEKEREILMQ